MSITKKLIGILGGSFDPIHTGHTQVATQVLQHFNFDRIDFVPNFMPACNKILSCSAEHRSTMVALAIEDTPKFHLNLIELNRKGPSKTIDTLRELRKRHPQDALAFIMGEDSYNTIDEWHNYEQFLDLCHLIVVKRNHNKNRISKLARALYKQHYQEDKNLLKIQSNGIIMSYNLINLKTSSTEIRSTIGAGMQSVDLAPQVSRYIEKNGLYTPS